jgi:hypothetical protein
MFSSVNNKKFHLYFFTLFIIVYALLFLVNPQLGPNDDFVFLRTLQSGKPLIYASDNFPYYDWKGLGRFHPLVSWEYNFIGLFSKSPSPFWYYFIHSLEFIIFVFLFVKLLQKITSNKLVIYGLSVLLFLLPGFTFTWFRLQLPERNLILLFTAFLLCLFAYQKNQKSIYLILGFILANLAIYYKEIVFIIIFVFALMHLILSRKNPDKKIYPHTYISNVSLPSKTKEQGSLTALRLDNLQNSLKISVGVKAFDYLLILSSIIYAIIYYFYIYKNAVLFLFRKENLIYNPLIVYLKNIFNYAFFSDPILILLLLSLATFRIYKIFVKKENPEPLIDSMLTAGSIYVLAFFILKLYNPYYLLPTYAFAIPSLIYFLTKKEIASNFWKITGFIAGFLLIVNSIPAGIHFLTWHKYVPVNFNKTLDFLKKDALEHPTRQKNIFLDNQDLAGGRGTYFIFGEFLQYKGAKSEQFDLKSNIQTEKPLPISEISKIILPYTVFQKDTSDEIKSGDYLIVVPQSSKNTDKAYLQSLQKDYDLIFQTKSKFAFPQYNLKTAAKYFLSKRLSMEQKSKAVIISENLLDRPDYYVFVKK